MHASRQRFVTCGSCLALLGLCQELGRGFKAWDFCRTFGSERNRRCKSWSSGKIYEHTWPFCSCCMSSDSLWPSRVACARSLAAAGAGSARVGTYTCSLYTVQFSVLMLASTHMCCRSTATDLTKSNSRLRVSVLPPWPHAGTCPEVTLASLATTARRLCKRKLSQASRTAAYKRSPALSRHRPATPRPPWAALKTWCIRGRQRTSSCQSTL